MIHLTAHVTITFSIEDRPQFEEQLENMCVSQELGSLTTPRVLRQDSFGTGEALYAGTILSISHNFMVTVQVTMMLHDFWRCHKYLD
jgi:hypothetical protein